MSEIPAGAMRFNSDSQKLEYWNGSAWFQVHTATSDLGSAGDRQPGARAVFPLASNSYNQLDYVNTASTGNALDFGTLTDARLLPGALASSVRGLIGGGTDSSASNIIDHVTILSRGNASDFGDLTVARRSMASFSNNVRGIWAGGDNPSPAGDTDRIQYVTIASTGSAQDFGDLSQSAEHISCTDNSIRGVWGGGVTPTYLNVLQYVTIATTGDAKDFGDLSRPNLGYAGGTSDSHGGLG